MPWFRLDDSFHSHPKVIAAGNEAIGLFVRCGTYAAQHLTDGFIPEHVALLYGSPALADALVRAKLWRRARGGWQIHDFLNYNPTREAVENERKAAAERQRRRRGAIASRRESRRDIGVTHATPTRPDPNSPLTPAADAAGEHAGQHKHCRACGTSPRGLPPPSDAARHPSARPIGEAVLAAGLTPNGTPARGDAVHQIAARARQAITQENP